MLFSRGPIKAVLVPDSCRASSTVNGNRTRTYGRHKELGLP